jgi:hypothetical protein
MSVARTDTEAPQGFGGSERVESFCGFALLLFVGGARRAGGQPLQEWVEKIAAGTAADVRLGRGCDRSASSTVWRPRLVVALFNDAAEHESIPVTRHRADELRLARIVAESPAERAYRLAQGAVGNDDILPDGIEDVAAMHRLVAALDQKDQEIEVPRDQAKLAAAAEEQSAP